MTVPPVPATEYQSALLPDEAREIAQLIRDHQSFLIIGHLRPDGDCLGSCLGLYEGLLALNKSVRFYTAGPVPETFFYLAYFDAIETTYPADEKFDVVLCVDTADENRVHRGYEPTGVVAVIDHHISNSRFGAVNWVDGAATAAAEQIYRLLGVLDVEVTPSIATSLYTGIMTDSGGFRFGNTTETTFRVASDLVASGAQPAKVAEAVWSSRSPGSVKISALVLSTVNYEFDGRLAWNEVTRQMISTAGATDEDADGLSGEMRSITGVEVAILFSETADEQCRIGFRSRGDVNVSELAGLLGGGGHRAASGATIAEEYQLAQKRALEVIREYLKAHFKAA